MEEIRRICSNVKSHIPAILDDWGDLTDAHPWMALPDHVRMDHLPELVDALVDACVCAEDDREARVRAVRMALLHGQQRNDAGLDDDLLFREYHLLREAIWKGMRRRHRRDDAAFEAIARIDAAITVATRGSLEGYHGQSGDEIVDKLVDEGPWPRET